jgi:hypothetical protein
MISEKNIFLPFQKRKPTATRSPFELPSVIITRGGVVIDPWERFMALSLVPGISGEALGCRWRKS